jgi:hypothetical protein
VERDLTVFVVGAGASAQFGVPAGARFNDLVVRSLLTDAPTIQWDERFHCFQVFPQSYSNYPNHGQARNFAHEFQHSGQPSIDAFLSARSKIRGALTPLQIAWSKAAIFRALAHGEQTALKESQTYQSWISKVFQHYERCRAVETQDEGSAVRIITFNYDQIIEHVFATMIANTRKVEPSKAIVEAKAIVQHVYGRLPTTYLWDKERQCFSIGESLKARFKPAQVIEAEESIFVVGEERDGNSDDDARGKAKAWLSRAKSCFFMGFGFSEENVRYLEMRDRLLIKIGNETVRIGSTGMSLTQAARWSIAHQLARNPDHIEWGRPDGDCNSYFGNDAIL